MGAFGNYEKDAIVYAIRDFAEKAKGRGLTVQELVSDILEAVRYGVDDALSELGDE